MDPMSKEYSKSVEYQMSSLKDIMDAEETEDWIEQRSEAVAEWRTRKMGKKERWEIDRTLESDVSTEAIDPGSVQAMEILNLKNKDKGESLAAANSYPPHHPRYTKTKESPKRIQQFMGAEKMIKAGGLLPAQSYGCNDQHGEGKDHQSHDRPDVEAVLVEHAQTVVEILV